MLAGARLQWAEFRKLVTTRLWLWLLLASAAWAAGYCALAISLSQRPGGLTPPPTGAAGQHALFAIGACGGGLGALLGSEVPAIAGLLLYLRRRAAHQFSRKILLVSNFVYRLRAGTGNQPRTAASYPGSPRSPAMFLVRPVPALRREATP